MERWLLFWSLQSKCIRELLVYAHSHKRLIYCFRIEGKKLMKEECRSWNLNGTKKEREKGWEGERDDSELLFHIYVQPKFTYLKILYSTSNYIQKNIVQSNRCWQICKHFGFCFSFNDTFACEVFGIFLYVFNGKSLNWSNSEKEKRHSQIYRTQTPTENALWTYEWVICRILRKITQAN